jgi:N-acetylmuramoyl-L-alanine amidase
VRSRRLAGKVVVLDAGHQIGNSRHRSQVNRLVNAGAGVRKACNSTGTQTNAGYPESRVAMRIALAAKKRLEAQGATVRLTRPRESLGLWGPCVDVRGRFGNRVGADAVVSIHADGASAGARGFHVIRPASVRGWTDDVARPSRRLAVAVHGALVSAGQRPATYIGSRDGFDVRRDLGTLNWSDRPICMVELGNMRNARDAAMLTDPRWQDGVAAAAVTAGVVDFLS